MNQMQMVDNYRSREHQSHRELARATKRTVILAPIEQVTQYPSRKIRLDGRDYQQLAYVRSRRCRDQPSAP